MVNYCKITGNIEKYLLYLQKHNSQWAVKEFCCLIKEDKLN